MPEGSYPFPMYSGILEPGHYKRIGSAIWLFLWCISSTTTEQEKEGTVWGNVLGGKPMRLSEIAGYFEVNDKTVSRWLNDLETHQYLEVTRAPRGLILKVRNSKKRSDKNVRSVESEQTKMSDHETDDKTNMSDQSVSEQTEMSDHTSILDSDQTNMSDLKDIKDLTITTTATKAMEPWDGNFDSDPPGDGGMIEILNAYCKMNNKLDFHVSQRERLAMGKMVAGGTPNPFTIQTMASMLDAKRQREKEKFKFPNTFLYYAEAIEEAWQNHQDAEQPKEVSSGHQLPEKPRRLTKQEQEIAELEKFIEEERRRGNH